MAKTLTAAAVEKLRPDPTKRREVADGGQPNLYFIIQPSGARSWAVRYRLHGKPHKFTVGNFPTFGLADARAEARKVLQLVNDGRDPTREREARRQAEQAVAETFEAACRQWLERHAIRDLRSWREPARVLGFAVKGDHLAGIRAGSPVDRWRHRPLASITRREVRDLFEEIEDTPVAANRRLAWLSSMFAWHLERERIAINPCAGIKRLKEASRDRVLDDNELRAVWLAADKLGWPFGPIVRLVILTGCRREEIGGLRWSEIDGDCIKLPADRVKNGKAHTIPLSAPAQEIIAGLHRVHKSEFVFNLAGARRLSGFDAAKARLDELSGVTGWTLHDLRRTLATGMQKLGISFETREMVLGHESWRSGVAGVYGRHDYASEKRAALDIWARHVVEFVEGRSGAKVVELNARR